MGIVKTLHRRRRGKNKAKAHLDWKNFEDQKYDIKSQRELSKVIQDLMYYDLCAPYQRDECWSVSAQKNLIQSIIRGIPIGAIHLVRKQEKKPYFNVLDAKQRLAAIKHFVENKFSIEYKDQEYYFRDLVTLPENKWLLDRFQNSTIVIVEWEPMPIRLQRTLFEIINQSASLNSAEKIYCTNFLARCLLKRIYLSCLKKLTSSIRGEIKHDKRFSGVMWTHRVCQLLFGPKLDDSFSLRPLNQGALSDSARELDTALCNYFDEKQSGIENFSQELITDEVIEDLGLSNNINFLRKLAQTILNCINFNYPGDKIENGIDILDFMCFIADKIQIKVLTISQIESDLKLFHSFYKDFVQNKKESNLAKHTTDKDSIAKRKDIFEKLFVELPVDRGIKNKSLTVADKAQALLEFDGICPIGGNYLTKDNIAFDHVDAKSLSSETKAGILSKRNNNLKSNTTPEFLDNAKKYYEDKS